MEVAIYIILACNILFMVILCIGIYAEYKVELPKEREIQARLARLEHYIEPEVFSEYDKRHTVKDGGE